MPDLNKPDYSKQPLPLDQQAARLIDRGLLGVTKSVLQERLARISYYRWRGYTYPYQDNTLVDTPFLTGTKWSWIEPDYEFDRKLRTLVFSAIERFEVALRTQMVLKISLNHGSRWYTDVTLFHDRSRWQRDLEDLMKDWDRSKEVFVEHYKQTYSDSLPPPAWMIFETTTLGSLSKFLENLNRDLPSKHQIADFWGFRRHSMKVLTSWCHHLNLVRNLCAHHSRLFSRVIKVAPIFPAVPPGPWVDRWPDPNRLYASLCILTTLLDRCSPEYDFRKDLSTLVTSVRPNQLPSMGFPQGWANEPLFQKGSHP